MRLRDRANATKRIRIDRECLPTVGTLGPMKCALAKHRRQVRLQALQACGEKPRDSGALGIEDGEDIGHKRLRPVRERAVLRALVRHDMPSRERLNTRAEFEHIRSAAHTQRSAKPLTATAATAAVTAAVGSAAVSVRADGRNGRWPKYLWPKYLPRS